MSNIEYDTYRWTPPPSSGSRFRLVVIFFVVLAVTAAVIYLLLPKSEPKPPPAEPKQGETPQPAADETTPTLPAEPVVPELPDSSEADTPPDPTTVPTETPPVQPTEEPVKGVPWSGDAPEASPAAVAPEQRAESEKNWQSVLSGESPWVTGYTVSRGDSLGKLAQKFHTTVSALKELNKLKKDTIYIGQKLRVVPGPWRIEASKSNRQLKLINRAQKEERVFAVYDIGIGRQNRTPSADFVISIRLRHPEYIAPDGSIHPYGSAENPLGDYFLKLAQPTAADRPLAGYGIHGTGNEAEVGRSLSHGCIRMKNDEVKQLYLLCPVATPVRIME